MRSDSPAPSLTAELSNDGASMVSNGEYELLATSNANQPELWFGVVGSMDSRPADVGETSTRPCNERALGTRGGVEGCKRTSH
jgi:hypothetical protein